MTDIGQTPIEPQRLVALKRANTIRLARAEFKRKIAEGALSAATVILENPESVRRWTVSELLMAQRRWGSTRCRKFLQRNGVGELKTIGTLTDRQRRLLARQLGGEECLLGAALGHELRSPQTRQSDTAELAVA